jgi:hypothetical protein
MEFKYFPTRLVVAKEHDTKIRGSLHFEIDKGLSMKVKKKNKRKEERELGSGWILGRRELYLYPFGLLCRSLIPRCSICRYLCMVDPNLTAQFKEEATVKHPQLKADTGEGMVRWVLNKNPSVREEVEIATFLEALTLLPRQVEVMTLMTRHRIKAML